MAKDAELGRGHRAPCGQAAFPWPPPHRGAQRPHTLLELAVHGRVDPRLEAQGPKYCEPGAEDPAIPSRRTFWGEEGFLTLQVRSLSPQQFCLLPTQPGLSQPFGKDESFLQVMVSLGSGPAQMHICLPRPHQTLPPASASSGPAVTCPSERRNKTERD